MELHWYDCLIIVSLAGLIVTAHWTWLIPFAIGAYGLLSTDHTPV